MMFRIIDSGLLKIPLIRIKKERIMEKEFDYDRLRGILSNRYGEILSLMEECPGVLYVSAKRDETDGVPCEYYIVLRDAAIISCEGKAYGQLINSCPELLVYPFDKPDSGHKIIAYEIYRYKLQNKLPVNFPDSLHEMAIHSAEYHPDYFGLYPAPMLTPHGYLVRYRTLDNGIFLLETDCGEEMVAFCFPLWQVLSRFAQKVGEHTDYDLKHGIDETKGYLFFSTPKSCIAFFELWPEHPEWSRSPLFNFPAIMNAIWKYFPDYAAVYNLAEQNGINSISETLSNIMTDINLEVRPEKMISMTPKTGIDFIDTRCL